MAEKKSKWQKMFSAGFTGEKLKLSKREQQKQQVEAMKEKARKEKAAMDKRGY